MRAFLIATSSGAFLCNFSLLTLAVLDKDVIGILAFSFFCGLGVPGILASLEFGR